MARLILALLIAAQISWASAQSPPSEYRNTAAQEAQRSGGTQAAGYHLSPDKYEKAVAFSRAKYRLHFVEAGYGLLILLLLLWWRVAPVYRNWAERISRYRFVQAWIFAPFFLMTTAILGLPAAVYGHWLSRKYEQSIQGWDSWIWDWSKNQIIAIIVGSVVIGILYRIIRRSARRWWFYFWLATIPITVFVIFISPLLVEPLFFKFEPLQEKHPDLVAQISKLVERAGLEIPPKRMFEMKASEKLKSLNAYVAGIGPSKRVVVWDTTTARLTNDQTLFVFGHEMGHYVLRHIPKLIAFVVALLFVFLYVGYRGMDRALRRWGARWQIRGAEDWASFPVLLLFLSVLSFLAAPLGNALSRHYEHQADVYGLEIIHGIVSRPADAAVLAFQALGEANLADPNPSRFIEFWLYDHPPLNKRILFAQSYDPWSSGHPQFVK